MRFLIIGQSVVDEIDSKEGFFIKPGGIFYSAAGFLQVAGKDDELFLLSNVSQKEYEYFKKTYDSLNLKYIRFVDKLPHVKLKIWENKERDETYTDVTQTITVPKQLERFDGIFVNMISGFEITYQDLGELRKKHNGKIYFDIHTLSRGMDKNNNRYFRRIPNITHWLDNVDIVQCNENEMLTICNCRKEKEIAEYVLSLRPEIMIITKGEKGASLYTKSENGLSVENILPVKVKPKNKVGCGDVFGATFFYFYIKTKNIKIAFKKANTAAGLVTQYLNIDDIEHLKNDLLNYYD